jgi:tRNA (guanine-N7-)-methyltransferase
MPRKKLIRFAEISTFQNVIENPRDMKGRWNEKILGNPNPIILELACGKGEYTIGLAERFPERNFIGVDKKGERIWVGAKKARQKNLNNVVFVRSDIERIAEIFDENEISEIWITFPDPHPRRSQASRRLTSPALLDLYRTILAPGGLIHLKTDDIGLYKYTLRMIRRQSYRLLEALEDLYADSGGRSLLTIKTTYEMRHLSSGKTIKYIRFGP